MTPRHLPDSPETLLRRLTALLADYQPLLGSKGLREKVLGIVPAFHTLRALGASLLAGEETSSGRDRVLAYLRANVGKIVKTDELMVVSGIGEYARRIRELRVQYGWPIISGATAHQFSVEESEDSSAEADTESGGDEDAHSGALEDDEQSISDDELAADEYILLADHPDVEAASRWKVANTIRRAGGSVSNRILEYLRANVGKPVTGEELVYVARNKTEWARRARELRTDHGWPVATRYTGRPDLPVGSYVLEEDRQTPPHDRRIPDAERRKALMRDHHTCTECGWSHDKWNRSDARHLELHHVTHYAKGGKNAADNLVTLCNICHDERHRREHSANT